MIDENNILDDDFLIEGEPDPRNAGKIKLLRIEIDEKLKVLKHGRLVLIILIILSGILSFVIYNNDFLSSADKYAVLIEAAFMMTIYIALSIFALKYPKIVFITALIVYTLNTVAQITLGEATIYSGIIFRIIIIFYFAKSIKAAFDLEKKALQHHQLGGQKDW